MLEHLAACSSAYLNVGFMTIYCKINTKIEHTLLALHPGLIRVNKATSWCAFYFPIYNKHSCIRWMPLLVMAFRFSAVTSLLCFEHLKWQFIIWGFLLYLNEQFLYKYSGYCLRWETRRTENQGLMSLGAKVPPPPKISWLLLDKHQTMVFIARKVASA